jgi:hypothetical protein
MVINNFYWESKMRVLTLGLIALTATFSHIVSADVIDVKLHYVGPTDGSAWQGVNQGLQEANIQGEFLGQKYSLKAESADELIKTGDRITAVIVAGDDKLVAEIANNAKFADIPVLNVASDSDTLRQACLNNLLNIPASHKMKQDALKQWLTKHPDSKAHIQGWHEGFKKFAASQLNKRYKKTYSVVMDDDAWAGWASVKLVSDTVARTQSDDASAILTYLKNDLTFDGQKGASATFRDTGQLRQLVLVVDENNKIAAEAPLRGVKGGLDSLGLKSCK